MLKAITVEISAITKFRERITGLQTQPAYCTSIPDADAGQMRLNAGLD